MKTSTWFAIAAVASFGLGYLITSLHGAERFDRRVRADFFRGFQGDSAALERGLRKCEDVLKVNPKDAERKGGRVRISVTDDGPGFDTTLLPAGHRLENLQSRLESSFLVRRQGGGAAER